MLLRHFIGPVLLAAGSMWMAGCHSARTPADAAAPARTVISFRKAAEANRVEAHAHYATAVIHELNSELEQALNEYYHAALKDPGNETLVLETTRQFIQAKQPERALEILLRATAQPNASGAVFARLGFVYARLNKTEEAIKASRTAVQREPKSLPGYQNLFLNHLQAGQTAEALKLLDEAAKVRDTGAEFLIGLAEMYANLGLQTPALKDGAFARAEAVLKRAENSAVPELSFRMRLADAYNTIGRDERAGQIYGELVEQFSEMPILRDRMRAKLADIYLQSSDSKRAAEQLEQIIRVNPTDPQAYYTLGNIAFEARQFAQAADYFTKTILLLPEFEPAYYDLAGAQLGEEKPAEALATLEKARQKFSPNFALEYLAGVAHRQQGDFTNAVNHFTAAEVAASARAPQRLTAVFYFEFGVVCERKGDFAEAEKYFKKCLELSPNFAEAQNYLGYMWADRGENLEAARVLIEKALKAEPESAAYLDSMGWVLFKLNRHREALDYMLQAIKFSEEDDATIYDHLGDIYSALGEKEKAAEAWRKSLAVEANEDVKKKLAPADGKRGE